MRFDLALEGDALTMPVMLGSAFDWRSWKGDVKNTILRLRRSDWPRSRSCGTGDGPGSNKTVFA